MTAGISAGIIAGRIVGGWLNDEIGWRGMFLVFATACAIIAVSAFFVLPGGSLGTAFGAAAVGWFGWTTTSAIAAGAIALAMFITVAVRVNTRSLG